MVSSSSAFALSGLGVVFYDVEQPERNGVNCWRPAVVNGDVAGIMVRWQSICYLYCRTFGWREIARDNARGRIACLAVRLHLSGYKNPPLTQAKRQLKLYAEVAFRSVACGINDATAAASYQACDYSSLGIDGC